MPSDTDLAVTVSSDAEALLAELRLGGATAAHAVDRMVERGLARNRDMPSSLCQLQRVLTQGLEEGEVVLDVRLCAHVGVECGRVADDGPRRLVRCNRTWAAT